MAFDLYVGPVTRYVLGDWKTVGQQIAEAQGLSYKVVGPGARKPKNLWQRKAFEKDNARWRRALGSFLLENGVQEPLWDDSPQQDFLSDRPGWEGYTGLILRYAYLLRPDRLPPSRLPSFGEMNEDPVVEEVGDTSKLFCALAYCWFWLPGNYRFLFGFPLIEGPEIGTTSLAMLNAALDEICELWGKDRATVVAQSTDQPTEAATVDEAAFHALAVFCRLADDATLRNLPMIVDA